MKTRVTITLDPEILRLAKKEARKNRTTVSGLIESLRHEEVASGDDDWVSRMMGNARLKDSPPGVDPLYDALTAKYIR